MKNHIQPVTKLGVCLIAAVVSSVAARPLAQFAAIDEDVLTELSETYAYYMTTLAILQAMAKNNTEWRAETVRVEDRFVATYGASSASINQSMSRKSSSWEESKTELRNALRATEERAANVTGLVASNFLRDVDGRIRGAIPSPVIETLLMHKPGYQQRPEREFLDGYRKLFHSMSRPMTASVAFHVGLPQSWSPPNSRLSPPADLVAFSSENGRGLESVTILAGDYPFEGDEKKSEAEIRARFEPDGTRKLLQEIGFRNARYINSRNDLSLGGRPAGVLRLSYEGRRLDQVTSLQCVVYMIWLPKEGKSILIMCQVHPAPFGAEADAMAKFAKFEKLFELVANSLSLGDVPPKADFALGNRDLSSESYPNRSPKHEAVPVKVAPAGTEQLMRRQDENQRAYYENRREREQQRLEDERRQEELRRQQWQWQKQRDEQWRRDQERQRQQRKPGWY